MIVTVGKNQVRDFLINAAPTAPTHIEIGDSGAAEAAGQTALQGTDKYREAFAATGEPTATKMLFQIDVAAGEATDDTYQEVGVFNAGAAGDMFLRQIFDGIVKDATIAFSVQTIIEVKKA
jgi:hypothetical protein